MTTIVDVPSSLGEYMLKGWVLTNKLCSSGCGVPLMRSPDGQLPVVYFCAKCDGSPASNSKVTASEHAHETTSSISSLENSVLTRQSTPPTEISSGLSSPTFAIPPESDENRRRRAQSDRASEEIGRRMLRGWAMLGEDCPHISCFGIPLVRPPKNGTEQNPSMECVVCGSTYKKSTNGQLIKNIPEDTLSVIPEPVIEARDNVISSPTATPFTRINQAPSQTIQPTNHNIQPTLDISIGALDKTLRYLSNRLLALGDEHHFIDPASITATVDAIDKTTQTLSRVRALQWSEQEALQR